MKFKKEWEEYTKQDKVGFIIYLLSLVGMLVWLFHSAYLTENLVDMFRLTYMSNGEFIEVDYWNLIAFTSIVIGFWVLFAYLYHNLMEFIFYPDTKEERELKKAKRKMFKKYPFGLAKLKEEELEKEFKLKKLTQKIKEWKNKNE